MGKKEKRGRRRKLLARCLKVKEEKWWTNVKAKDVEWGDRKSDLLNWWSCSSFNGTCLRFFSSCFCRWVHFLNAPYTLSSKNEGGWDAHRDRGVVAQINLTKWDKQGANCVSAWLLIGQSGWIILGCFEIEKECERIIHQLFSLFLYLFLTIFFLNLFQFNFIHCPWYIFFWGRDSGAKRRK